MKDICAIYSGETWHCRHSPAKHSFKYPYCFISVDVDQIPHIKSSILLGVNRRSLVSLWEDDYLHGRGPLASRVRDLLLSNGVPNPPARIRLLTVPRLFGYVFNPVSFYLVHGEGEELKHIICEVNNTFGESHLYLCSNPQPCRTWQRFSFAKRFYVSPFLPVDGDYELFFKEQGGRIEVQVHVRRDGQLVFSSAVRGKGRPASAGSIAIGMLRSTADVFLVMTRIHLQAFKIYLFGKVSPIKKPPIGSGSFVKKRTSVWFAVRNFLVERLSREGHTGSDRIFEEVNNG